LIDDKSPLILSMLENENRELLRLSASEGLQILLKEKYL
jgi:hypothetical protein